MAVPALVQYVTTCNMLGGTLTVGSSFRLRFSEKFLSGNLGIIAFQYGPSGGGAQTFTVTDDQGGTWTAGASTFDSTNIQGAIIYYRANMTANARVVSIVPSGSN